MRKRPVDPQLIFLSLVVAGAVFVLDLLVEPHIAAPVAYVGLILMCRGSTRPDFALWLGGLATVLTVGAHFLESVHDSFEDVADRGLALGVIWLTAVLCSRGVKTNNELEEARAKLKEKWGRAVTLARQARSSLHSERTDRERVEDALEEAEHRYRGFFNQTFQLAAVLDPSGAVEEANETLLLAGNVQAAEITGRPVWALPIWRGEAPVRLRRGVAEAAAGNFYRDELEVSRAGGNGMVVDLSLKPIRDASGQVDLLILEARDVTQHKRDQEMLMQAQKMEVLGQLASGISHDFNNLLTVIGGNLELVGRRLKGNEVASARLDKALNAVFQGRELTDQMLAFARKQNLSPQTVDLNGLIIETAELFRRGLDENSAVQTDLATDLWFCRIDPAQFQMALLSILINARDAMPNGGRITIHRSNLTLRPGDARPAPDMADGQYVVLSVADEGEGIPAEVLDKVTEPFFTTKRPGKGTGLGLSMVYGLMKSSGGDLRIESDHGLGTKVSLYLPRSLEAPSEPISEPEPSVSKDRSKDRSKDGGRVLVVEDEPEARDVAVSMLSDLGYDVEKVGDAKAALELLRAGRPFDLMVTDIMMPGDTDGTALGRLARSLRPDLKILYTSGNPRKVAQICGPGSVREDFVPKPYRYGELVRQAEKLLARRMPVG